MKILITGALGYLGGQLTAYLRQFSQYQLRLLVRSIPPQYQSWLEGLEIWRGDVTKPATLAGIGDGIDAVVHLIALDAKTCQDNPIEALRVNGEGTLNLLAALGGKIKQFIYVSTFHVYGKNGEGLVTEETPIAPIHPYATTHAIAELYTHQYAQQQHYQGTIIRLSNSYGPPLFKEAKCWSIVVNDLCRQAIEQQQLVLHTPGLQLRNFIAGADVMRGLQFILNNNNLKKFETLNMGGLTSYSILEVAQKVQKVYQELSGNLLPIQRPEPRSGTVRASLDFRSDKIQALGFFPKISLEDNIRRTLQWKMEN